MRKAEDGAYDFKSDSQYKEDSEFSQVSSEPQIEVTSEYEVRYLDFGDEKIPVSTQVSESQLETVTSQEADSVANEEDTHVEYSGINHDERKLEDEALPEREGEAELVSEGVEESGDEPRAEEEMKESGGDEGEWNQILDELSEGQSDQEAEVENTRYIFKVEGESFTKVAEGAAATKDKLNSDSQFCIQQGTLVFVFNGSKVPRDVSKHSLELGAKFLTDQKLPSWCPITVVKEGTASDVFDVIFA